MQVSESKEQNGYDDLFDEDDGGLLDECRSVSAGDEDEDDDLVPATRKPRNRGNVLDDDENSRGATPPSDAIRQMIIFIFCNYNEHFITSCVIQHHTYKP